MDVPPTTLAVSHLARFDPSEDSAEAPLLTRRRPGYDLHQNLFFEFTDKRHEDPRNPSGLTDVRRRMRRIMQPSYEFQRETSSTYTGAYKNYSEVTAQLSPAWLQWLRHTRLDAPSIGEQIREVQRQAELKRRVEAVDRKWKEAKQIDDRAPRATLENQTSNSITEDAQSVTSGVDVSKQTVVAASKTNPWKKASSGPSENWQPAAWDGGAQRRPR